MAGRSDLPPLPPPPPAPVVEPGPQPSVGIAASARRLDPAAAKGPAALAASPPEHVEAWAAYKDIPEVNQIVSGSANLLSQCRFYVGVERNGVERPAIDSEGVVAEGIDAQLAADAEEVLSRFRDANGAQRGLILAIAEAWDVVGEAYLVGWPVDDDGNPTNDPGPGVAMERWEVLGRARIKRERKRWKVDLGDGAPVLLPETAVVYRFWRRHPEVPEHTRSWVLAAVEPCRDLRVFTAAQRSAGRSHIVADLLLIPSEAAPARLPAPGGTANPAATPPASAVDGAGQRIVTDASTAWALAVEKLIGDAVAEVVRDTQAGRTAISPVMSIPGKTIEQFKKLALGRPIDEALETLIEQARKRIADAADTSPEFLFGLGATNRWNGAQIDDTEYRRYFKPKALGIADSWTMELLWGGLAEMGYPREKYRELRVLVDPGGVVAEPDRRESANDGLRMGAINYPAWREAHGWGEDAAPSPEEAAALMAAFGRQTGRDSAGGVNPLAGSAMSIEPDDLAHLLHLAAEARRRPATAGRTALPTGRRPALTRDAAVEHRLRSGRVAIAALLDDPERLAAALAEIEVLARTRLEEAAEQAFAAALTRAGAKLRNWARRDGLDAGLLARVADAPTADVPSLLGPEVATRLAAEQYESPQARRDDLFAAALAALVLSFRRIAEDTYRRVLTVLGVTLAAEEIAANVERGSEVYRASVLMWADEAVFGPAVQGQTGRAPRDEPGEVSDLAVPLVLAARGLAAAGGAQMEAGTTPTPEAANGLTFGPALTPHLPYGIEGWRWEYGMALRHEPWSPHLQIDGQVFTGPNDPGLLGRAPDGGPGFPQDHAGCRCFWVPVLGDAD